MALDTTDDAASVAIASFRPTGVDEHAAAFAKAVVARAAPLTKGRAKALLFAASRLAAFGQAVGLSLEAEMLLSPSVIERFVTCARLGEVTRRTVRSNLRFLAGRVLCHPPPAPLRLPRERAKAPYSDAEIASYLALCDAQPTRLRQVRASALVCLSAGAGLIGGELRHVRASDVCSRSGGVLVLVGERRARAVPVLGAYHERLVGAAGFFGDAYLLGADPDRHNVTTPLIRSLSGGADLPRLETTRLRSTYLVAMAEAIGLRAFMDAAGITCSQRLGDLVAFCSPVGEEAAVAILRGQR